MYVVMNSSNLCCNLNHDGWLPSEVQGSSVWIDCISDSYVNWIVKVWFLHTIYCR